MESDGEFKKTAFILMTSAVRRGDAEKDSSNPRFAMCIAKPICQSQLYKVLATALGEDPTDACADCARADRSPYRLHLAHPLERGFRILVAEDNICNQMVVLGILEQFGYRADAVANGKEAVASLRNIPYDLVLMDCEMPEMNGYEATASIRDPESGVGNREIPIVALTAHAMKGISEKCLDAGMNDYLTKPIHPATLAAVLEKWLPRGSGYSHSPSATQ
jgi:two-component system, sensor histidine kinase and response regulator